MTLSKTITSFIILITCILQLACSNNNNSLENNSFISVSLDSAIIASSVSTNQSTPSLPFYYLYFTINNQTDSVINIQIEQFKDFDVTKDSLISYFNNLNIKLYASYRKHFINIEGRMKGNLILSPDPGELIDYFPKELNADYIALTSNYLNNSTFIFYFSNPNKSKPIKCEVIRNKGFKIISQKAEDLWW
jgi:hypothetical protein